MRLTDEQVQAIADLQYPNLNALAAEVQEWRARYGDIDSQDSRRTRPAHGRSAYAYGCRCDTCRAANTEAVREWRARKRHPANTLDNACERCQAQPGEWCLCLP